MPFGGLFLAGGLTPKNIKHMRATPADVERDGANAEGPLLRALLDKGRMRRVLERVPVCVTDRAAAAAATTTTTLILRPPAFTAAAPAPATTSSSTLRVLTNPLSGTRCWWTTWASAGRTWSL